MIRENQLIQRLHPFAGHGNRIIRGIGDDCAVVEMGSEWYVFTQDAMVENVHFTFAGTSLTALGRKALYVNISDILSMGADPLYYLVTIGLTKDLSYRRIRDFYKGMDQAAREFGVSLLGGDTVESKTGFFVDVSMTGHLRNRKYYGREKARKGDLIAVTGVLGESAYGLELLQKGVKTGVLKPFIDRHTSPRPPLEEWKELVERSIPNGMMDVSDGLLIDLERMMKESHTGARIDIDRVPVPEELKKAGRLDLALSGGEDYQLLFTFPQTRFAAVESLVRQGLRISVIGEVSGGRGVKVYRQGKRITVARKGYEHFGEDR